MGINCEDCILTDEELQVVTGGKGSSTINQLRDAILYLNPICIFIGLISK